MTFNSALADEIIGIINADPRRHNNDWWVTGLEGDCHPSELRVHCGTAACVAGWAAILTVPDTWCLDHADAWDPRSGVRHSYASLGREALGLRYDVADWLFSAIRTQAQVLWALKWLQDNPDASGDDIYDACPR